MPSHGITVKLSTYRRDQVWNQGLGGTMDVLEELFQGLPLKCNSEGYRDVTPIHTVLITETQVTHGCP